MAVRHVGVRQVRGDEVQGEGALGGDGHAGIDGGAQPVAVAGQGRHLVAGAQPGPAERMGARGGGGDVLSLVQRGLRRGQSRLGRGGAGCGGGDDLGETVPLRQVVKFSVAVDVGGAGGQRELYQAVLGAEGCKNVGGGLMSVAVLVRWWSTRTYQVPAAASAISASGG